MIGQLIGDRYQIDEHLGTGGMGTVYKGMDTHSGEAVAIKLLKPEALTKDPAMIERFAREGEALRQVNHPNIVKMLGMLIDGGNYYLVIEYMPGGDLRNLLAQGQVSVKETLEIALDLSDALTRAHRLQIVHRDLKPANILLDIDGRPRLTDFGVAHMGEMDSLTGSGTAVGTLDYLAPEALNGGTVGVRADIWSFGVILFEMLTGQRPFTGKTLGEIITAILTKPTPDLEELRPDLPIALVDLIYRMLEKSQEARISSARLIGADLEAIMQGGEITLTSSELIRRSLPGPDTKRFFDPTTDDVETSLHNLPAQTTPFVGREGELTELRRLLADSNVRLVTVVAPGGMGKTRLSLEVAGQYIEETVSTTFPDGVYFVPLASLTSSEQLIPAVADAVGYQFQSDNRTSKQQLLEYLNNKTMLLLLDNFEHVTDDVSVVGEILEAAPDVQVIATSRARLNLSGETVFNLGGMDFPDWQSTEAALEYSAVKLFIQSARRTRFDFELESNDLEHIARICRLVQGMPLAILLAAAWVEMLSLKEIADEINQNFDFLETEMTDLPQRQRSIRAVFDYSWKLLNDKERELFTRLSVFRGRFTRESAQSITGANLRALTTLVTKSLLLRDPDSGRYVIQMLAQQYAEEKLEESGEAQAARDAHLNYFTDFMIERELDIKGRDQIAGLDAVELNFENIRAAWYWAVQQKNYTALDRMLEGVKLFFEMRYRFIERQEFFVTNRMKLFPQVGDEPHPLWCRMMVRYAGFLGHKDDVRSDFETCLEMARKRDEPVEAAYCLFALGDANASMRDFPNAVSYYQQAMEAFRDLDERFYLTQVLNRLGAAFLFSGQLKTAYFFGHQSLQIGRQIGNKIDSAWALHTLMTYAFLTGLYDEGEQYVHEAHTIWEEAGNQDGLATTYYNLAWVAWWLHNELDRARKLAEKALEMATSMNHTLRIGCALSTLGTIDNMEGNYVTGIEQCQKAIPMIGAHMPLLAPTYAGMAHAATGLKDFQKAKDYHHQAIQLTVNMSATGYMTTHLPVEAAIKANENEKEWAVELMALYFTSDYCPPGLKQWTVPNRLCDQLKTELGSDIFDAAWERGQSLDLETVIKEILSQYET